MGSSSQLQKISLESRQQQQFSEGAKGLRHMFLTTAWSGLVELTAVASELLQENLLVPFPSYPAVPDPRGLPTTCPCSDRAS